MPRAGDPRLIGGALPITHNPNERISVTPPKLDHLIQPAQQQSADRNASSMSLTLALDRIFHFSDWAEYLSGNEDGDPYDLGTKWLEQKYKTQATINNIVNSLFGWLGGLGDIDWGVDDSEAALKETADTVAALSAAIAALQNDKNNAAIGGKSAVVDFTQRAPASTLGDDFEQRYSLTGDGQLGINNGAEWLTGAHTAPRYCKFLFTDTVTATSYQRIGIAFGSAPEPGLSNNRARNEIHGRVNADHTRFVYASMEKYQAQLGFEVDGFATVWKQTNPGVFSFKSNAIYWLECGSFFVGASNIRIYRLLEGEKPILTHTEIGTSSYEGEDYRGTGGAVYAYANGNGTNRPGRMAAFAMADNYPATLVGSYAEVARTSTSAWGDDVDDGLHELGVGFWDTVKGVTEDFRIKRLLDDPGGAIEGIEVLNDGQYLCEAHFKRGITWPDQVTLVLYVNGVAEVWLDSRSRGTNGFGGNVAPNGIGASKVIPLQAGDVVSWGYESDGVAVGALIGEATGKQTIFSVTTWANTRSVV